MDIKSDSRTDAQMQQPQTIDQRIPMSVDQNHQAVPLGNEADVGNDNGRQTGMRTYTADELIDIPAMDKYQVTVFFRVLPEEAQDIQKKPTYCRCNICGTFTAKSRKSWSNLVRHMEKYHGEIWKEHMHKIGHGEDAQLQQADGMVGEMVVDKPRKVPKPRKSRKRAQPTIDDMRQDLGDAQMMGLGLQAIPEQMLLTEEQMEEAFAKHVDYAIKLANELPIEEIVHSYVQSLSLLARSSFPNIDRKTMCQLLTPIMMRPPTPPLITQPQNTMSMPQAISTLPMPMHMSMSQHIQDMSKQMMQ